MEILSPAERRSKLAQKLSDYEVIGVPEVWLVIMEAETVEVLALKGKPYERAGLYGRGDKVRPTFLTDLALSVDATFS